VSGGRYLTDNLVRHMLRCELESGAIALLSDCRWIEIVNDDEKRLPFYEQLADLKVLRYLMSSASCPISADSTDALEEILA